MAKKIKKSFAFIGDAINISNTKSTQLDGKNRIKKASIEQIRIIKDTIDPFFKTSRFGINFAEYKRKFSKRNGNEGTDYIPLPSNKWKYYVIEHDDLQLDLDIILALALSKQDLTFIFDVTYSGMIDSGGNEVPGIQTREVVSVIFYNDNKFYNYDEKNISAFDILEINELIKLIKEFRNTAKKNENIDRSLNDFLKLKEIPYDSPFKVLGFISILENILTTNNSNSENSITHQLKKKLTLINNFSKNSIDIHSFFKLEKAITFEKIIGKIYDYRSRIAHGGKHDLGGDLQLLKSNYKMIRPFLNSMLKQVLVEAMKNPKLIANLKEC